MRLAIIGSGGYAGFLIERLLELSDCCELAAVFEYPGQPTPALALCEERGIAVFHDVGEMLGAVAGHCGAVVVPTGIASHREMAARCFEAGYQVLLEKPPTASVQELDALAALEASQPGRWIAVNFQYLYSPFCRQLQRRLIAGEYGRLRSLRAVAGWPRPVSYFSRNDWAGRLRHEGGWVLDGCLNNPMAHVLAQMLFLSGTQLGAFAEPARVEAELYHCNEIESEDTSCLRLETREGVVMLMAVSLCSESVHPARLVLETDEAQIDMREFKEVQIRYRSGGRVESLRQDSSCREDRRIMFREILGAMEAGRRPPLTVSDCRPFVLAVNGAFESAGLPRTIGPDWLQREGSGEERRVVLRGSDAALTQCFEEGRLFSELGLPWARACEPFTPNNYDRFPCDAGLRALLETESQRLGAPAADAARD